VPGTAVFSAHQLVSNLDWNRSSSDILSLKYYFQDDPTVAPYAYSMVAGFTQILAAGSQVISLQYSNAPAQFQHHRNHWVRAAEYLQFRRAAFFAATNRHQYLWLYAFSGDEHCRYFGE
jgi:predicted PolB exonuclease-like 3'-5' exonuclease